MAAPIECQSSWLLFLETFCSKLHSSWWWHMLHRACCKPTVNPTWTPSLLSVSKSQSSVPHTSCWYWAPLWLHTDMFACKSVHLSVISGQLISKIIIYEWSNFRKMPGEASSILNFSVRVTPPLSLSKYLDRDSQKCLTRVFKQESVNQCPKCLTHHLLLHYVCIFHFSMQIIPILWFILIKAQFITVCLKL